MSKGGLPRASASAGRARAETRTRGPRRSARVRVASASHSRWPIDVKPFEASYRGRTNDRTGPPSSPGTAPHVARRRLEESEADLVAVRAQVARGVLIERRVAPGRGFGRKGADQSPRAAAPGMAAPSTAAVEGADSWARASVSGHEARLVPFAVGRGALGRRRDSLHQIEGIMGGGPYNAAPIGIQVDGRRRDKPPAREPDMARRPGLVQLTVHRIVPPIQPTSAQPRSCRRP